MPTYAYTCTVCGHSFDVRQSFDDAPMTVCPECSGRLRKVFSPVGVVFKGSGFYRNDARSSSTSTVSAGTSSSPSASSPSPSPSSSSSSGTTTTAGSSSSTATAGASSAKAASA